MLEQVHEMEENIRRAKKGDFKVSIHKMEVVPCLLYFNRCPFNFRAFVMIRFHKQLQQLGNLCTIFLSDRQDKIRFKQLPQVQDSEGIVLLKN